MLGELVKGGVEGFDLDVGEGGVVEIFGGLEG